MAGFGPYLAKKARNGIAETGPKHFRCLQGGVINIHIHHAALLKEALFDNAHNLKKAFRSCGTSTENHADAHKHAISYAGSRCYITVQEKLPDTTDIHN